MLIHFFLLIILDIICQSLLKILNSQVFSLVFSRRATDLLWWDEDIGKSMDDSILGHAICDSDMSESIDANIYQTTKAADIDREELALQKGWKIDLNSIRIYKSVL